MRSWSKRITFSRRWKSSMRLGPRVPACSELSVFSTGMPWSVVNRVPSCRTRADSSWLCLSTGRAPVICGLLQYGPVCPTLRRLPQTAGRATVRLDRMQQNGYVTQWEYARLEYMSTGSLGTDRYLDWKAVFHHPGGIVRWGTD